MDKAGSISSSSKPDFSENPELVSSILESSGLLICRFHADFTVAFSNREFADALGVPLNSLPGSSLRTLLEKENLAHFSEMLMRFSPEMKKFSAHCPLSGGDDPAYFQWSFSSVRDSSGNFLMYQAAGIESSETHASLQRLKQIEHRYAAFFEQSIDGVYFVTFDEPVQWENAEDKAALSEYILHHSRFTEFNDAFLKQYNISREKLTSLTCAQHLGYNLPRAIEGWKKLFDKGATTEISQEQDSSGVPIWIQGNYVCRYDDQKRLVGHFGLQRDISEFILTEQKILEREKQFSELFETSRDGIVQSDLQGIILDANSAFVKFLGYDSFEEIRGKSAAEITSPDFFPKESELIVSKTFTVGFCESFEKEYIRKDGSRIPASLTTWLRKDSSGSPIGLWAIVRDIREQKKLERELRQSELKYRKIFENVQDVFYQTDLQGVITSISPSIERYSEYTPEELVGRPVIEVYSDPAERERLLAILQKSGEVSDHILKLRAKSGRIIFASTNVHFLRDASGNVVGAEGSLRDISERKRLDDALTENMTLLKTFINAMPDIVCFKDGEGRWLEANDFDLKLFGLDGVDYYGKKDSELAPFSPFYYNAFMAGEASDEEAWQKGAISRAEEIIPSPSGIPFIFDIIKIPVFNEDGSRKGLVVIGRDITEHKKVEEALRTNEELFRELIENQGEAVSVMDANENFVFVNPSAEKLFGSPASDLLGKNLCDFLTKQQYAFVRMQVERRIEGLKDSYELDICRPSGEVRVALVTATPRLDSNGNFIGTFGVLRDITEFKQSQEEVRKLSLAVEQSPSMVIITDVNGKIEYVNKKFSEITGFQKKEIIGQSPHILKSGEMPVEAYRQLWLTILSGNEWHGEFHNRKKSGELYWESASISPIFSENGAVTHFIAVKEDITERKLFEIEIKRAAEVALESSRLKSSLLANMSHELRTPLNGILGFSQLLEEEITDPVQNKMLSNIIQSGQRLMRTLNSILDLSELESNKALLKPSAISLHSSLKIILNPYELKAKSKNLFFEYNFPEDSQYALCDDSIFKKIVINLIDNAVKFTSSGGIRIQIQKSQLFSGDNHVAVHFIDTGIGISKEDQDIIFDEFRQASEGYSRNYEGSGLGLTIARKMARLVGGDILVRSTKGKGSDFIFLLPSANEQAISVSAAHTEEISSYPLKHAVSFVPEVLLVEDNLINKEVVEKFLKQICTLDHSIDGEGAVKMVAQKQYDLILMDINLGPGIDGIEAAQDIRRIPGYEKIPIVALTGYAMTGDKERLLSSGLTHYLAKPFEREKVVTLVKSILSGNLPAAK